MKMLQLVSGMILAITSIAAPAQAIESNAPHLHGSAAIPNDRNALNMSYRFYVHVQGASIDQLSVNLPDKISYEGRVTITNQAGKKVGFASSLNEKTELIKFDRSIEPNEVLTVDLDGIRTKSNLIYRTLFMPVSVNENKINAVIPIGTARIQLY